MSSWGRGPIDIGGGRSFRIPRIPGAPPPNTWKPIVFGVLLVLLVFTSYFQVDRDEVGVVQRFGRYVRTVEPGPHAMLPFGIETVTKVFLLRGLKMEFGFRTESAGIRSTFAPPTLETTNESVMLTGDLNVAVVQWIVQYRIKDPRKWLFDVRDPDRSFRDMAQAAMRQVVGDRSVDEVLTFGRESVALEAKESLQKLCDLYGIGITVQQLILQDVNPPDPVKPAFNEVNQAIQEKERAINDAWADYNKSVPRAKGQAEQAVRSAEGYALERVNKAEGDAKRFEALYEEYKKAPAVTRRRIYLEAMAEILPKVGRKLVVDEKSRGILPLLDLGGTMKEVKP
jgi:membrane protease subunit HflK